MRNLPNIYCSFSPGMPVVNGTPGSLVNMFKKVLVYGTDPVSINEIVVANNVATITFAVNDELFLNGSRIVITGCNEPNLNSEYEVDYHNKAQIKFATTVADGTYGGTNLKINQPGAGWELLFSGTNEAVFVSGNPDTIGVCIKIIDINALYAEFEFYEDMTSLTVGINKFPNNVYSPTRVMRYFKSSYATATKQHYWVAADNTSLHFCVERISSSSYTPILFDDFRGGPIVSMGECQTFDESNTRNFYFNFNLTANSSDTNSFNTSSYFKGVGFYKSSAISYDVTSWNGGLLTENQVIGAVWTRFCISPTYLSGGNSDKVSGGFSFLAPNYNLPPLYLASETLTYTLDQAGSVSVSLFGRLKETLYLNQNVRGSMRVGSKYTHNGKKFILLPTYYHYYAMSPTTFEYGYMGMVPFLVGERWE